MRAPRLCLAAPLVVLALASTARADEPNALERVRSALEKTRQDLEAARIDAAAASAEAARISSAAETARANATARVDAARSARRTLAAREARLRSENEKLASDVEALEAEVAQDRDALRRAALEAAASLSRTDARLRCEAAAKHAAELDLRAHGAELASVASSVLGALREEARAVPVLTEESVTIDGLGARRGRVLRIGPGAWFFGQDGTEAIRRGRPGAGERFVACRGEGIAAAFAGIERGAREVDLPLDATGTAAAASGPLGALAALLVEGGFVMVPLGLLWLACVFLVVERLVARRRIHAESFGAVARFKAALASGDMEAARRAASEAGGLGRSLSRAVGATPEAASRALDEARRHVLGRVRERLWMLGTIASLAPFVGLLGTVIGIVRSFRDMARTGSSGFAVVAAGISEALVATAAGIVVAVVAVLAFNALQAAAASLADAVRARAEAALDRGV